MKTRVELEFPCTTFGKVSAVTVARETIVDILPLDSGKKFKLIIEEVAGT